LRWHWPRCPRAPERAPDRARDQFLAPGNQTRGAALEGGRVLRSWHYVTGIEVLPALPPAGVLVAIGDSITDGSGAGLDADERWTGYLVRRGARSGGARPAGGSLRFRRRAALVARRLSRDRGRSAAGGAPGLQ